MKNNILLVVSTFILLSFHHKGIAQAPNLGTAANFVLFSTNGAVTNTGTTHLTGNVGTNNGSSTGFGNVDGVMHNGDGASASCASDLLTAYNQLNATIPTYFPASLLGNGQILTPGVYSIPSAATLNLGLTLDAQNNASAVFIIKIQGSFSTGAGAKVKLINGALACNVFWKVEGLVSMATGTSMKGTVIANNAAITMNVNDTLEGRALSTTGAVTVHGMLAYTPLGCGRPILTGPAAPALASAECYTVFSSNGTVTNSGVTHVTGDVGTNGGLTTGFDTLLVTGKVHPMPDISTAQCAADLHNVYTYLNSLPDDIQLLYPAQFGSNLTLTPHTYHLNAATVLTDTVFLNAEGNANAVFVFKINGAFSTSTYSYVKLINGAQAKNVFWKIEGAASINNYSVFCGTMVVNNGAITALNTGVVINGRAFTTTGSITTTAITAIMPPGCASGPPTISTQPIDQIVCADSSVSFSVIAHGTSLTYQWRKGNINLVNGGHISGANAAILTIDPAGISDTSSFYNVIVRGSGSPNDTSVYASLLINVAANITTAPGNKIICAGRQVSFSVLATGAVSYQWRKGTLNLINGSKISGATTATLTIDSVTVSDAALNYNVIINGTCGNDTSGNVSLVVNTAPSITTPPTNKTTCAGSSTSFSVAAAGTGLTYQWRKGTINITNTGNTSGATSATLMINPVNISNAATNYNVIITGTCGNDTSGNVSLIVNTAPSITTPPADHTACAGSSASFSVAAAGTGLTYQWRKGNINITNAGNTSGATSATLVINPVNASNAATNYNVVITGTCAPATTSGNVSLAVNAAPSITTPPTDETLCAGSSASFSIAAAGTGLTYQWRKGTINITNAGNTSGATSAILVINPLNASDAATNYNVIINGTCGNDTSNNVSLAVNAAPSITIPPTDQTACDGSAASFSVAAAGTGLTYQWRKGTINATNAGNTTGATSAILVINPVNASNAATNYNVVITGTCAPAIVSGDASLSLCPTAIASIDAGVATTSITFSPNPFRTTINITVNDISLVNNCDVSIYNILGKEMMSAHITRQFSTMETSDLPSGVYIYKVIGNGTTIQSGRLISSK